MKKLLVVAAVALVVAGGFLLREVADRKSALASDQADPVRAVETFMGSVARLSGLMWEKKQRDKLKADAEKLDEMPDEEARKEAQDIFEKHGLPPPYHLFARPEYGKAAVGAFLIHSFDSSEVTKSNVGEKTALVSVQFTPKDVLGLQALTRGLGAPKSEVPKRSTSVSFKLEKRRYRWYITEIGGDLRDFVRAVYRLRKLR